MSVYILGNGSSAIIANHGYAVGAICHQMINFILVLFVMIIKINIFELSLVLLKWSELDAFFI